MESPTSFAARGGVLIALLAGLACSQGPDVVREGDSPAGAPPEAAAGPARPEPAPPVPVVVDPAAPPQPHPLAPESLPNKPPTIPEEMPGATPPREP